MLKNLLLFDFFPAWDGSTRVLRDSTVPVKREGGRKEGENKEKRGSWSFIQPRCRISYDSTRVIKFLQFKFPAPIPPTTEKLDYYDLSSGRSSSSSTSSNSSPALIFRENFQLPFEAAVVKILGEVWTKCTAMRTPPPPLPLSFSLVED